VVRYGIDRISGIDGNKSVLQATGARRNEAIGIEKRNESTMVKRTGRGMVADAKESGSIHVQRTHVSLSSVQICPTRLLTGVLACLLFFTANSSGANCLPSPFEFGRGDRMRTTPTGFLKSLRGGSHPEHEAKKGRKGGRKGQFGIASGGMQTTSCNQREPSGSRGKSDVSEPDKLKEWEHGLIEEMDTEIQQFCEENNLTAEYTESRDGRDNYNQFSKGLAEWETTNQITPTFDEDKGTVNMQQGGSSLHSILRQQGSADPIPRRPDSREVHATASTAGNATIMHNASCSSNKSARAQTGQKDARRSDCKTFGEEDGDCDDTVTEIAGIPFWMPPKEQDSQGVHRRARKPGPHPSASVDSQTNRPFSLWEALVNPHLISKATKAEENAKSGCERGMPAPDLMDVFLLPFIFFPGQFGAITRMRILQALAAAWEGLSLACKIVTESTGVGCIRNQDVIVVEMPKKRKRRSIGDKTSRHRRQGPGMRNIVHWVFRVGVMFLVFHALQRTLEHRWPPPNPQG